LANFEHGKNCSYGSYFAAIVADQFLKFAMTVTAIVAFCVSAIVNDIAVSIF
jgi:hypothetical protein